MNADEQPQSNNASHLLEQAEACIADMKRMRGLVDDLNKLQTEMAESAKRIQEESIEWRLKAAEMVGQISALKSITQGN